jgi:hypothetical protein
MVKIDEITKLSQERMLFFVLPPSASDLPCRGESETLGVLVCTERERLHAIQTRDKNMYLSFILRSRRVGELKTCALRLYEVGNLPVQFA